MAPTAGAVSPSKVGSRPTNHENIFRLFSFSARPPVEAGHGFAIADLSTATHEGGGLRAQAEEVGRGLGVYAREDADARDATNGALSLPIRMTTLPAILPLMHQAPWPGVDLLIWLRPFRPFVDLHFARNSKTSTGPETNTEPQTSTEP